MILSNGHLWIEGTTTHKFIDAGIFAEFIGLRNVITSNTTGDHIIDIYTKEEKLFVHDAEIVKLSDKLAHINHNETFLMHIDDITVLFSDNIYNGSIEMNNIIYNKRDGCIFATDLCTMQTHLHRRIIHNIGHSIFKHNNNIMFRSVHDIKFLDGSALTKSYGHYIYSIIPLNDTPYIICNRNILFDIRYPLEGTNTIKSISQYTGKYVLTESDDCTIDITNIFNDECVEHTNLLNNACHTNIMYNNLCHKSSNTKLENIQDLINYGALISIMCIIIDST